MFTPGRLLLAVCVFLAACVTEPDEGRAVSAVISDQNHGGQVDFVFLPPVVPAPAAVGDFLPDLSPTVIAEQLAADGATVARTLGTWTRTSAGEKVRVHLDAGAPDDGDADPAGYFVLRFRSGDFPIAGGDIVRFRVELDGRSLGSADVKVLDAKRDKKLVDRNEYGFVVAGKVLRVKFRIDRRAVETGGGGGGGGSGGGSGTECGGAPCAPDTSPAIVSGVAIGRGIYALANTAISFIRDDGSVVAATTRADGTYTAEVPPGNYVMSVSEQGFTPFRMPITLNAHDEIFQDVILDPYLAWVEITVLDAGFHPLAGASVTVEYGSSSSVSGGTDSLGHVLFKAQPIGFATSVIATHGALTTRGEFPSPLTPQYYTMAMVLTE